MQWTAQELIALITALTSFITAIGGTYIGIKQSSIAKKVDDAKTAATMAATKLAESAETRAAQMTDLKQTIIAKTDEIKAVKGNGTS